MVKRSHGAQNNTRKKLSKRPRDRGKVSLLKQLQSFEAGDNVVIKVEPSIKKNTINKRFMSKPGIVMEKRGNAYKVRVNDMGKEKDVFVLPVHLKKI